MGVGETAGAGRRRSGRPQNGRTDWCEPPFPVVVPSHISQHNSALSARGLVYSYRNKLLAKEGIAWVSRVRQEGGKVPDTASYTRRGK